MFGSIFAGGAEFVLQFSGVLFEMFFVLDLFLHFECFGILDQQGCNPFQSALGVTGSIFFGGWVWDVVGCVFVKRDVMVGVVIVGCESGGVSGVMGVCVVVDLIGVLYFILEIDNLFKVRLVVHIGYVDCKKNEPKTIAPF